MRGMTRISPRSSGLRSLTPKDMDFLEAKHTAAREIALAFGVPPMLLGIPGDNTFANYAEANRVFFRQTVLPLAARVGSSIAQPVGRNKRRASDAHCAALREERGQTAQCASLIAPYALKQNKRFVVLSRWIRSSLSPIFFKRPASTAAMRDGSATGKRSKAYWRWRPS